MQGKLQHQPLIELLAEIAAGKLSGAVRVQRERVQGVVYTESGRVVGSAVNLRAARLSECVRRWKAVEARQLETLWRAAAQLNLSDDEFASRMISNGAIGFDDARRLREQQAYEVLHSLLAWSEGDWTFDARARLTDGAQLMIDDTALRVEAARRAAESFAALRFNDYRELINQPDDTVKNGDSRKSDYLQNALKPVEAFVLSRVDVPLCVGDLQSMASLPAEELQTHLYTLTTCGLLAREHPPRALTNTNRSPAAEDFPSPSDSAKHFTHNQPANNSTASGLSTDSSTIDLSGGRSNETTRAPASENDEERQRALLARGHADNHYFALGVNRSANNQALKTTYYALAKRFHPDTFQGLNHEERHAVETAFARITRAYEVLRDENLRLVYDRKLGDEMPLAAAPTSEPTPPVVAQPPTNDANNAASPAHFAEQVFSDGINALKHGNHIVAQTKLSEAASRAPHVAKYRAHLGALLAREAQTRRAAEAELRAAVNLEPHAAEFRVMLAEFYRDAGFTRRAIGELERAVAVLPKETRLRRLLNEMKRASN